MITTMYYSNVCISMVTIAKGLVNMTCFIDNAVRKRIRRAFRHISKKSCIKFVPKMEKHKDYVRFISGTG